MRLFIGLATTCLIVTAAVPLHAQTAAPNDSAVVRRDSATTSTNAVTQSTTPTTLADTRAPSRTGLRAGVHRPESSALVVNAAAANAHLGQSRALMIVGGAALIAGAIIGGDPGTIIMVGGAVIGLYGLYQYLQ